MGSTETKPEEQNNASGEHEMVKPIFENGRFKNPFDTYEDRGFFNLMKLMKQFRFNDDSRIPTNNKQELDRVLPVLQPDFDKLNSPPENGVQYMWVGHASVLVQLDGLTLLTDPIWASRCGPLGITGPKRYRDPPCSIEELPNIDAVVISHNHYDHLDHSAVTRLNRRFGDKLHWFVAAGQRKWMNNAGCENVTELSWWEEATLEKNGKTFTFVATPAQHWCKRTATDDNKALWCSWVVKGPAHNFYFAGDTGYCFGFKQIGYRYGPFSLAAIPIGAYEPRWFMRPQHVDVDEAVSIHEDIKSQHSIGIHWGTFRLTTEYYLEPREKLSEIVRERGLDKNAFVTVKCGDVLTTED